MLIYSKQLIEFVKEIKRVIKKIITEEIDQQVIGDRFYNKKKTTSYPIKVVIYNNKTMLGYFDPNFYEIGIHDCLRHYAKDVLHDVIRHELAHYLCFIQYGSHIDPHGIEFKNLCLQLNWDERISKATLCLEQEDKSIEITEESIFRKIKKLIALSSSSNIHEAEQAMIKCQQLLLKHNIESHFIDVEPHADEEKIYLKRISKQKKENAKMRAIARILETFFVNVVYNRSGEFIYLEIIGDKINVEIAEYVALFLHTELDKLFTQAKKVAHLKGLVAKNSFFLGLARGYCNKIQEIKNTYSPEYSKGLIVIEKRLLDANKLIYTRLSNTKSSGNHCRESSKIGELMGRNLQINPAIEKKSSIFQGFISYLEKK